MRRTPGKEADRYLKIVEWSDEDGVYIGRCPGLFLGGVHGADDAKVYAELCQAVDEWIEIFKKNGRPLPAPTAGKEYSGKFVLRVPPEIHQALAVRALVNDESLNSFCERTLKEAAGVPSLPRAPFPRAQTKGPRGRAVSN